MRAAAATSSSLTAILAASRSAVSDEMALPDETRLRSMAARFAPAESARM